LNNFDLCRKNLYHRLGVDTTKKRDPIQMQAEIIRMTNKLNALVELARPRLIMGGIRYGSDWQHDPLMEYMQKKFDLYKETGNFEFLIDLMNFIAIEGELQTHPEYHFNPVDR
jgi:hypothetical protein